ncbi:MAG: glycosyltransferase family 2 protein [Oceanihabitans sp.]
MNPMVSIIIPCYNSETTLEDTLVSVFNQNFQDWEVIMVNDGSPDNLEEVALKWTNKDKRFKYYKKENGGLGSARNYGIQKAKGNYILPLDSDNKIRPDFVKKAIIVFEKDNSIGVVYGNAMRFGDVNEEWIIGDFDAFKMLSHNYIDACALFRKSLLETIGGYEESLPHQGHEDWELWLRVMKTRYKFYYLNETTFDYRVLENSMINSFNKEMINLNVAYIKNKHSDLYIKYYTNLYKQYVNEKEKRKPSLIKKIVTKLFS